MRPRHLINAAGLARHGAAPEALPIRSVVGVSGRRSRLLPAALALVATLAGCGGEGESVEDVVRQGNAVQIRAEYAAVDPDRAAVFEASGRRPGTALVTSPAIASSSSQSAVLAAGLEPSQAIRNEITQASSEAASPREALSPPVVTEVEGDLTGLSQRFAVEALAAINEARAQARTCGEQDYEAVGPVAWNPRAAYAALLEVEWMQADNTFGHQWPTGEHVWHRLTMAGYDWVKADENIAAGFKSLESAMQAWIDSPSHCRALMRSDITEVGVAVIPGNDSNTYLSYWAMVLATPRAAR